MFVYIRGNGKPMACNVTSLCTSQRLSAIGLDLSGVTTDVENILSHDLHLGKFEVKMQELVRQNT